GRATARAHRSQGRARTSDPAGIRLARDVQDVPALEVGSPVDAPVVDGGGAGPEERAELVGSPEEELPLLALRVRVLRGVEAAAWICHLAQQVVERFLGDAPVLVVAEGLVGVQVEA